MHVAALHKAVESCLTKRGRQTDRERAREREGGRDGKRVKETERQRGKETSQAVSALATVGAATTVYHGLSRVAFASKAYSQYAYRH